ncbi:MAG: hypothetical protein AB9842_08320 [Bacteroidales bacterium]
MSAISFKLDRFAVCQVHGTADIIVEHNAGNGIRRYEKSFHTEKDAILFVNNEKRAYIRLKLETFVKHKKVLFETGKPEYYNQPDRLASFDICQRCLAWIHNDDQKLKPICSNIIKIRHHLQNILPMPGNPSLATQEEELQTILLFCHENS